MSAPRGVAFFTDAVNFGAEAVAQTISLRGVRTGQKIYLIGVVHGAGAALVTALTLRLRRGAAVSDAQPAGAVSSEAQAATDDATVVIAFVENALTDDPTYSLTVQSIGAAQDCRTSLCGFPIG